MFILGHVGLTIGLLILIFYAINKKEFIFTIDLRVIAIFAMLPDMIDKTIGHVIFRETLNNGRLIAHTMVFLVAFAMVAYLLKKEKWWLFTFPIFTHHIFDLLWYSTKTLFWPYYGWWFEWRDVNIWENWIEALFNDPYVYCSEIIGIIIIVVILIYFRINSKDKFLKIFKEGQLAEDKG